MVWKSRGEGEFVQEIKSGVRTEQMYSPVHNDCFIDVYEQCGSHSWSFNLPSLKPNNVTRSHSRIREVS